MPEFSSTYNATLDDKRRVVLPAPFKKEMGRLLESAITVELDPYEKCFNIYPADSWEKRVATIRSRVNTNDPKGSRVLDMFYQRFVKVNVSENGRLNIPNAFLDKLGIVKDVVFTGQGDKIRMWEAGAYRQSILSEEDFAAAFEDIFGGPLNSI